MNYFNKNSTEDKIKQDYKKLVVVFHPDMGGDKLIFQNMQAEYEVLTGKRKAMPESKFTGKQYATNNNIIFTFGKYKGKLITKCTDKGYLIWAFNEVTKMPDKVRQAIKYRIDHL